MKYLKQSQFAVMELIHAHPRSAHELEQILGRSEVHLRRSLRDLKDYGLAWHSGNVERTHAHGSYAYKWSGSPPPITFKRKIMITHPRLVSISRDLLVWLRERGVYVTASSNGLTSDDATLKLFLAANNSDGSVTCPVEIPSTPDGYDAVIRGRSEWVLLPDIAQLLAGDKVIILEHRDALRQELVAGEGIAGKVLLGTTTRQLQERLIDMRRGGEVLAYRAKHLLRT